MEERTDGLKMIERIAAGDFAPDVQKRLRECMAAYLLAGAEVSMERCMRVPNTPHRVRLAQRDAWIRKAALTLENRSSHAAATDLESELRRFVTRGRWAQLQGFKTPPEGLAPLTVCLFHIARLNDGETLSSRQIHRLIRHEFPEKCPPDTPTIEPVETTPGDRQLENRC